MGADTGPLCLLFSYQLWGEAQGNLRVLLRDAHQEETLLWTLRGDQGPVWKEGRTILPRSPKEYQVPNTSLLSPSPPISPRAGSLGEGVVGLALFWQVWGRVLT